MIVFRSSAATVGTLLACTWPASQGTSSDGLAPGSRGTTVHAVGVPPASWPTIWSNSHWWKTRLRGSAGRVRNRSSLAFSSARWRTVRSACTAGPASGGTDRGRDRISAPLDSCWSAAVTHVLIRWFMSWAAASSPGGTPRSSPAARARKTSRSSVCRCCWEAE
ncbi:hypothetical protein [Streptomyces bobili]|uniref:hypothetical protein n=1 Tax=Streptomyces bobili TaxID=67280 RepID=UPI002E2AE036|nr:hypothetical protein [Streptomyces bobili]